MKVSLIITTYNWPSALSLCLQSVFQQTVLPQEVIIADDGSGNDTAELINSLALQTSVPVIHSWQPDCGFRAARSRNKAIVRATGDYLIFIDGDIIVDKNFVADHLNFSRPNTFIQGSRVLLGRNISDKVIKQEKLPRFPFSVFAADIGNRKNCLRWPLLTSLCSRIDEHFSGSKTCNFSLWRKDIVAVNGFNEAFVGWGREDSELVVRLLNSGTKRLKLRFSGRAFHLYHPESERKLLSSNDSILAQTIASKSKSCPNGLSLHK